MKRAIKRWWWLLPLLLVGLFGAFAVWALTGPQAMPEAILALTPGPELDVETAPWLVFEPVGVEIESGLILIQERA